MKNINFGKLKSGDIFYDYAWGRKHYVKFICCGPIIDNKNEIWNAVCLENGIFFNFAYDDIVKIRRFF